MSSELRNLSHDALLDPNVGNGFKCCLVVSEYHQDITSALQSGALETLRSHGVSPENIVMFHVPGAYELIKGCQWATEKFPDHTILALGCVITGDTRHDEYINHAVAQAIMQLNLRRDTQPVIFGLLTPNNHQQAVDRAGGVHGNKGIEVAIAALKMHQLKKTLC